VAQIVSASIAGDIVLAAAYSHELPHFGLSVGLTNYAAGTYPYSFKFKFVFIFVHRIVIECMLKCDQLIALDSSWPVVF